MVYTKTGLQEYPSIKKYLDNLEKSTQETNLNILSYFMNWVSLNSEKFSELTPDDLINYQLDAPTAREQYELLDELVQPYIRDMDGSVGYKQRQYFAIRGFFKRNRAELPSDPDFKIKSDIQKTIGTLKIEEVKDIIQNAALHYKAAFLVIFQGGMDSQSFEYWNMNGWDSLHEQLRNNEQVVKINLPPRKKARNNQPYYTYIGKDAVDALRDYLKQRPEHESKAIIINDYGNPMHRKNVQLYWLSLIKRRGFVEPPEDPGNVGNRYGKNLHELRDVFRTQWQKAEDRPAPEVAEFMMGHGSGDSNEYNKFYRDEAWVRGEYLKALPMLEVMSRGEPFGLVKRAKLEKAVEAQDGKVERLEAQIEAQNKVIADILNRLEKEQQ